MWKCEFKYPVKLTFPPWVFSYQCGVDGFDLVLLQRPEARYLAAQVGVNQHLRLGKTNWLHWLHLDGKQSQHESSPPRWAKLLSYQGRLIVYKNRWFWPHFLERDPLHLQFDRQAGKCHTAKTFMWQSDFNRIVLSCLAFTHIKTLSKGFAGEDKLYSVTHQWKTIAWDIYHPAHSITSSPPAPSPCAQPAVCGRSPFQWGTSFLMPPQSAYPSAALHSADPRVSEALGKHEERKKRGGKHIVCM